MDYKECNERINNLYKNCVNRNKLGNAKFKKLKFNDDELEEYFNILLDYAYDNNSRLLTRLDYKTMSSELIELLWPLDDTGTAFSAIHILGDTVAVFVTCDECLSAESNRIIWNSKTKKVNFKYFLDKWTDTDEKKCWALLSFA